VVTTNARTEKNRSGQLTVSPECLNFGEVWEDKQFKWVLSIANPEASEVRIDEFSSSCSCTAVNPESLTIPARQSRNVELVIDLTPNPIGKTGADVQDLEFGVRAASKRDGALSSIGQWRVRGKVKPVIVASQLVVDFGRQSDRARPLPAHHVKISTRAPVREFASACSTPLFFAEIHAVKGLTNEYELVVHPDGKIPIGLYRFEVELTATLEKGVARRKIPIRTEIAADIQAIPPTIHFGVRSQGEDCREAVTLHSMTGAKFRIADCRTDGKGLEVDDKSLDKNGKGPIYVFRQHVVDDGTHAGKAVFAAVMDDGMRYEVVVPISYHGISSK
jgi:hypothetical protein